MRNRGSNSMYQQGARQQGGIVNNKSMAVSKFMATGGGGMGEGGLTGKSIMPNKSIRKVEGQDFGKTNKSTFQQTVSNLKNKPTQKVLEDEYIGGLQEEIKYLEYELKLLKDKQILEREGVNELDNFLKDEIPINQNILAMKNKYNATKAKLEQQLSSLNMKKSEAEDVLKTQKSQIDRLHQIIDGHRKQKGERTQEFRLKLGDIIKEIALAVDEYEVVGNEGRRMNQKVKIMHQQISKITRQNEKEKIAQVRLTEQLLKKKQKFQEKFKKNKEDMIETTQQCEELDGLEDTNPLIKPMEDQNSLLRKRIMLNQKQRSTAENTIAEIELFLKEEEREREIERQHKGKYLNVIEECRLELQAIERQGEDMLKDRTMRAKKVMIKEMNHQFAHKDDLYSLLTDRLRTLEQECSNLIQEKKECTDALETQIKTQKELQQQISETEENIIASKSRTDSLLRVTQEIGSDIITVEDDLEKAKGRLPIVEREIERKSNTIHYLNKQVDLLKELKALDLEQLHMISMSGSSMQNVLSAFIKNWEKIKSQ